MMMSIRIDVLSLMKDAMISLEIDNRTEQAEGMSLARVLVAEIMESAERVEQSSIEKSKFLSSVYTTKIKRLRDAINRAKGV